ncbi:CHAT domain-containing protein [Falsiroseomonas sp.]|uniref:CHAT domain-containing protein n=1 Tax=Falsiroseomonas sp. TaxID=2870721 RepID=UPI0035620326
MRRPPLHGAAGLLALLAASCTTPPPDAYFAGGAAAIGEPISAGRDAVNAECLVQPGHTPPTERPVLQTRVIFCGGWTQPAARVVELREGATPAALDAIATGGVWRSWLERRVVCGQPVPTTLSDGAPARLLPCTRRNGGWPHLALVTQGAQGIVLADGLPAALPAIERVAQGRIGPASATGARSAALTLVAAQLSAQAFGSADVGRYEQLMALGRELNQAENFAAAEDAYRGALRIQERVLGPDDPNVATPLMHLALNLSNQGRHAQAEPLFARAATLAPRAADPTAQPRLLHYRGLHALNAGQHREAAALLEQAERGYAGAAPVDSALRAGRIGADDLTDGLMLDPTTLSALVGIAEARRARGVALTHAGRPAEGAALAESSRTLLQSAGLQPGVLFGRSLRSQGGSTAELGREADAAQLFGASAQRFAQALPGERPEAATLFLAGARLNATGRRAEALERFRAGARILRERQIGLPVDQVLPYLDALDQEARGDPAGAAALYAEMFEAAQIAQRPQTTRLVAQAAARLGAAQGNPRVAAAVRRLQDADRELRALLEQRDAADPRDTAPLDERIRAAQVARAEAESEAEAAAPGYRQLLQAVAPAAAARSALAPREALVTMLIGSEHGYAFALRGDGTALARRVALPEAEAQRLVERIRAGITPPDGSGPGTFDAAAAHALHRALLAPLAPALDGVATLVVVPDGPLLSIPFGLLLAAPAEPTGLRDADWLIRRHAIVHMPSTQTLVMLRTRAGASRAPLAYVGFGDPVMPTLPQLARSFPEGRCRDDVRMAANLAPLPGTRAELQAARAMVGAPPGAVTLGQAFTAASLRNAGLDRYRIVHLATHALLPGELSCLEEPAVIASPPRNAADASAAFIEASEVLDLKLDADLVILSACNTGTIVGGAGSGGEALSGLSRAFFFAGARGLMVTHWPVSDAIAALTVADTLRRHAREGQDAAVALRGAQLGILDEVGRRLPAGFAHPFYWAGFALIGDGPRTTGAAARSDAAGADAG